jgi:hypothetical protein
MKIPADTGIFLFVFKDSLILDGPVYQMVGPVMLMACSEALSLGVTLSSEA